MLQDLPEPVQRCMAHSGVIGKPWINTVLVLTDPVRRR
jgi:hypothetical protein